VWGTARAGGGSRDTSPQGPTSAGAAAKPMRMVCAAATPTLAPTTMVPTTLTPSGAHGTGTLFHTRSIHSSNHHVAVHSARAAAGMRWGVGRSRAHARADHVIADGRADDDGADHTQAVGYRHRDTVSHPFLHSSNRRRRHRHRHTNKHIHASQCMQTHANTYPDLHTRTQTRTHAHTHAEGTRVGLEGTRRVLEWYNR
jgi:hypothetical protein